MKIDAKKIINEAKNRMILFKGGKLPKSKYNQSDYEMDQRIVDLYEEADGETIQ